MTLSNRHLGLFVVSNKAQFYSVSKTKHTKETIRGGELILTEKIGSFLLLTTRLVRKKRVVIDPARCGRVSK